jgi:hypothetical protein
MVAPMSRGGSRCGGQRAEDATQDGWNMAGPSITRVPNNLANFRKIGKTMTAQGPSNLFDVYTKKGATARDAAPTIPRVQSSANMFSALNPEAPADLPPPLLQVGHPVANLGSDGAPEAPTVWRKLILTPCTTIPAKPADETP